MMRYLVWLEDNIHFTYILDFVCRNYNNKVVFIITISSNCNNDNHNNDYNDDDDDDDDDDDNYIIIFSFKIMAPRPLDLLCNPSFRVLMALSVNSAMVGSSAFVVIVAFSFAICGIGDSLPDCISLICDIVDVAEDIEFVRFGACTIIVEPLGIASTFEFL
uniref:Uncharacterized protein n=1 Tax=Glossina pallidipes TaxID=7398 RepID=A0A1B0AIH9_GLOPL